MPIITLIWDSAQVNAFRAELVDYEYNRRHDRSVDRNIASSDDCKCGADRAGGDVFAVAISSGSDTAMGKMSGAAAMAVPSVAREAETGVDLQSITLVFEDWA